MPTGRIPVGFTEIYGAKGQPIPPFANMGVPLVTAGCAAFPRVDAYFSPSIGYRGTTATVGTATATVMTIGSCLATSTVESGWTHHQLGTLANP